MTAARGPNIERALTLAVRAAAKSAEGDTAAENERQNAARALGALVEREPEILLELKRQIDEARDVPPDDLPPPKRRRQKKEAPSWSKSVDDMFDEILKRYGINLNPVEQAFAFPHSTATRVEVRPTPHNYARIRFVRKAQ